MGAYFQCIRTPASGQLRLWGDRVSRMCPGKLVCSSCRVAPNLLRVGYGWVNRASTTVERPYRPVTYRTPWLIAGSSRAGRYEVRDRAHVQTMCTPEFADRSCRCRHHFSSADSLPRGSSRAGVSDTRSSTPPQSVLTRHLEGSAALLIHGIPSNLPARPCPDALRSRGQDSDAKAIIGMRAVSCSG